jgi:heme/copper-type cytochrome/quinol oxidase subunit 1
MNSPTNPASTQAIIHADDAVSHRSHYAKKWLALGISALALAGVFAVILVIARTPQLKELALFQQLFSVALVIHVDLSVLSWFLAMIALYLSLYLEGVIARIPYAEASAFGCMLLGLVCLTLSPLMGEWEVIKSNYIPVLHNVVFFLGLGFMAASMLILALEVCVLTRFTACANPRAAGAYAMALIILLALGAFALSADFLPAGYDHDLRYEYLFWAGGHTLQFAFTLMMLLAWNALIKGCYGKPAFGKLSLWGILALSLIGALIPLPAFVDYAVDSGEFQAAFGDAMIRFGGLASLLGLGVVARRMLQYKRIGSIKDARFTALVSSIVLFIAGGVLGVLITGQNVTIPAHYHGAIVGVTLALMGYAYWLMPQFGYGAVHQLKLAIWQPILYALGQLLHIGGLAYSGGYGVLRKTVASEHVITPDIKAALGMMGLGGLLAIIGGILFVVVMLKSYRRHGVAQATI